MKKIQFKTPATLVVQFMANSTIEGIAHNGMLHVPVTPYPEGAVDDGASGGDDPLPQKGQTVKPSGGGGVARPAPKVLDRKSTRLNSSHRT